MVYYAYKPGKRKPIIARIVMDIVRCRQQSNMQRGWKYDADVAMRMRLHCWTIYMFYHMYIFSVYMVDCITDKRKVIILFIPNNHVRK